MCESTRSGNNPELFEQLWWRFWLAWSLTIILAHGVSIDLSESILACEGRDKLDMEFRHSLQEQSVPHSASRKLGLRRMSLTLRSGVDESLKTTGRSHVSYCC